MNLGVLDACSQVNNENLVLRAITALYGGQMMYIHLRSAAARGGWELLEGGCFLNVDDARTEVFEYIECYYNRLRRHSSLGYKSPEYVENEYHAELAS